MKINPMRNACVAVRKHGWFQVGTSIPLNRNLFEWAIYTEGRPVSSLADCGQLKLQSSTGVCLSVTAVRTISHSIKTFLLTQFTIQSLYIWQWGMTKGADEVLAVPVTSVAGLFYGAAFLWTLKKKAKIYIKSPHHFQIKFKSLNIIWKQYFSNQ